MAQKVEIEVEISKTGEVHMTFKGTRGKACLDLAKGFEKALGEIVEKKLSPAYYETESATVTTRKR
jgi:hypothetical protein